jgi:hypothetical protein
MRAHQVGKLVHEVKTAGRTCGAGRDIFATLAGRSAHLTATASILSRCEIVLALASCFKPSARGSGRSSEVGRGTESCLSLPPTVTRCGALPGPSVGS